MRQSHPSFFSSGTTPSLDFDSYLTHQPTPLPCLFFRSRRRVFYMSVVYNLPEHLTRRGFSPLPVTREAMGESKSN